MATTLHMDTDEVRQWASLATHRLEEALQQLELAVRHVTDVDWTGSGRDQFTSDYLELSSRLRASLQGGIRLTQRVEQEVASWEEMAAHLGWASTGATTPFESWWPDVPDWGTSALTGLESATNINDWLLEPAVVIASLGRGASYLGEVRVFGSFDWKRWMLDLPPTYTTSRASTLLNALQKPTPSTYVLGGLKVASDWVQDYDKYKGDAGMVVAACGYDAWKAAAGVVASKAFMSGGMALGTAILPGVGTAVGGVVGSALGSFLAEAALGDSLWQHFGYDNPVNDVAIEAIHEAGKWVTDAI